MGRMNELQMEYDLQMERDLERLLSEYDPDSPKIISKNIRKRTNGNSVGSCDGECWSCNVEDCGNSIFDRD